MAYSFDQIFAADPSNPSNVAQNASITIFAPGDSAMTPIAITDPDGQALTNPIPVNANGFGSAFMAGIDRVAWYGGGFTGFFTSYEGMKAEAVAARTAADTAAANAATAESRTVTTAAVDGSGRLILTKADATTVDAGPVIGPTGATGPAGPNTVPTDDAIAAAVNGTGPTKTALNATYAPKWKANTAYLAGDAVLNPSGDTVTAKVAFTSGGSYNAANWNLSPSYAAKTSLRDQQTLATRNSRALRHARLALGDRNTNPCDIFFGPGDSITAGYTVSRRDKRWAAILLDEFRRLYPTSGVAGGLGYLSVKAEGNSSATFPDNPVTFSGGSEAGSPGFGLDMRARVLSTTGNWIEWAFTGTGFDIDWTSYSSGGSFTWAVDGGAASSAISTTGGAINTGSNTTQVRGLTAGAHTIRVTQSAGGTVYINGGFAYNGDETKGIRGTTMATLGWTTANWWPANTAQRYWPASVAKRSPDLVFIGLGANDFGSTAGAGTDAGPRTPAAYKANLQAIIAAFKSNVTGYVPSFVLLPYWTIGTGITPLAPYADYVTAQYEVAAEDPDSAVAVFDLQQRVNPGAPGTAGGFLPDNTHPTDPGNRAVAELLAGLFQAA